MAPMDDRTIPELGQAIEGRMAALGLTVAQAIRRTGGPTEDPISASIFLDARKGLLRGEKVQFAVARALEWDPETLRAVSRRELPVEALPTRVAPPPRPEAAPPPGKMEELEARLTVVEEWVHQNAGGSSQAQ